MRYVLFAFTAPWSVIVGWGWVGLMWILQAAKDLRWEDTLVLTAEWRPWASRLWKYSTTLSRGIIYQPSARADARTKAHEGVHVRQVEDLMLWSFTTGLMTCFIVGPSTGDWGLAFGLWFLLWFLGGMAQLAGYVTAAMRGGDAYRSSEHERSAYAQTDTRENGRSWLEDNAK